MPPARLTILGLGLLGGSVALAARRAWPDVRIVGYDPSADAARSAVERRIVSASATTVAAAVGGGERGGRTTVVVAAPVGRIAGLLREVAAAGGQAIVTDVGSAKRSIAAAGDAALPGRFVGAHPMAGGESSGASAARADLFDGATCVLTPTAATDPAALSTVRAFWRSLGAETVELSPADHDARVAAVSHLPHAVAAAVARAQSPESLAVSGRGYRDVTRVAAGGAALWADILTANADEVAPRLRRLAADLTDLADLLAISPGPADPDRLAAVARWLAYARASAGKPPAGRRPDPVPHPPGAPVNTFLQAVGVTALVVIGLVVLAALVVVGLYLWLTKVKLPQLKASLASLADAADTGRPTLTLEPLEPLGDDDALAGRPELRRTVDGLRAAGLEQGGAYGVKEMPGAVVITLADAGRAVFATASDVPTFGTNVDVITLYADGRSVVHRTMPATGTERPPTMTNVYLPNAAPGEVVARHLDERPMGDRRAVGPADVASVVVEQHEAEMDWRDAKGGTSGDEFRAAARHGKLAPPGGDDLDELVDQSRAQAAGRVEAKLRERFRDETTLTAREWDRVRDRLVFVFDAQHRPELAQALAAAAEGDDEGGRDWHELDEEIDRRLAAGPLREMFAAENDRLPADRRFEHLGEVSGPVSADVYAGPDGGDDED